MGRRARYTRTRLIPARAFPWRLLLGTLSALAPASLFAEITVEGQLLDQPGGAPISDARVIAIEARKATESDAKGRFTLSVPRPGYYTIRIIYGDRLVQRRKELSFNGQKLELFLSEKKSGGEDGRIVTSGTVDIIGTFGQDKTKLSRFRLDRDEIKRLPGVYGDSLKAVTTLPGVSPAPPIGVLPSVNLLSSSFLSGLGIGPPYSNSTSGVLVLRGAGPRASQFYLDGFKIQYPFHLGDQSSVLNNDFIRTVDVYTGTFPARFGNATGGVIAIGGPTDVKKTEGHVNLALFLADIYIETPFLDSGFIVATARQSYPNVALLKLYPDAIPANAKYAAYNDGQFKLFYKFNQSHEITAMYFGAHDVLQYTQAVSEASGGSGGGLGLPGGGASGGLDSNTDGRPPVGLDRGFHTQGLKYLYKYGGRIHNSLYLQVSRFKEDFELDFRSPLTGETIFGFEVLNARQEIQYRDELIIGLIHKHLLLNIGVEANLHRWELSLKNFSPQQSVNPNTPNFVETVNQLVEEDRTFRSLFDGDRTRYNLNAAYMELEIEYKRLRLTPGVRAEYYSLSKSTGMGPRVGAELAFKETGTTVLAAAGRHFNIPTSLEQISIESGNPGLEMEEADHTALGVEQKIGKRWLFKAEVFRNWFRNLVVEDQFNIEPFSPRNNRRELVKKSAEIRNDPFENRPLGYSNDGTGFSEGVELYLKKTRPPDQSGFFGWFSYSWSQTKRNNHQTRLSRDEQTALNTRNANRRVVARADVGRTVVLYYNTNEIEAYPDNDREELYDLDRTHQASLVLNYKFNPRWQLGGRWRYSTNTPHTPINGTRDLDFAILGRPTFIAEYSSFYNSERLKPVHQLDLRLDYFIRYAWGYANYYVEAINFYARRNPESQNFDFLYPYVRGTNPETTYESTYIETPIGGGRRLLLPLINVGIEIKF